MRIKLAPIFSLFLLLPLASCQTIGSSANEVDESSFDHIKPHTGKKPGRSLTSNLWSPAEKQATAGFYYLVGESVALRGDLAQGRDLFALAYELDPNPFLARKVVTSEAAIGDKDMALLEARKMVLLYPKSAEVHLIYGELLAQSGFVDDGISEVEKAHTLASDNDDISVSLVELYRRKGQLDLAVKACNEILRQNSDQAAALVLLTQLYVAKQDFRQALVAAEKAYRLQSDEPDYILLYAHVLELNKKETKSLELYEELFSKMPTEAEFVARTVAWYRTFGSIDSALMHIDALARTPFGHRPSIQVQKALLLWEGQRRKEAVALLEQAALAEPDAVYLRYMVAQRYEALGNIEKALEVYKAIEENSNYFIVSRYRTAEIFQKQRRLDQALGVILPLLKHKFITWEGFAIAAQIQGERREYEASIELLQQGADKYPGKIKLLFLLGVYQEKAGDTDSCIETMQQVVKKDPTFAAAYNYLAYLFAESGDRLDEAESLVLQALNLSPNDGYYVDTLGWVYYKKGDLDRALEVLLKAAALVPDEGVVLEHVADIYLEKQDAAAALDYYGKALRGKLEAEDRKRIEEKYQNLSPVQAAQAPK